MRRKRENQLPLSGLWPGHRLAQELRAVSKILDDNPSILGLVLTICVTPPVQARGPGSLRRAGPARGHPQELASLPYTKLAFLLSDSQSFRRFARLPWQWTPSASCLGPSAGFKPILAADQPAPGQWAEGQGLERGRKIRADARPWKAPSPIRGIPRCCPTRFESSPAGCAAWPDLARSSRITGAGPSELLPNIANHRGKRRQPIEPVEGRPQDRSLRQEGAAASGSVHRPAQSGHRRSTAPLLGFDEEDHRPDRAACAAGRDGSGRRESPLLV